ncbi:hypothetical protein M885DRAFT_471509 [Pelagophyceae sp. CCMP2097]|nr:hypothetical protein M885DRAFT_471509 [Pelagophyceae sp. CCMP2097]
MASACCGWPSFLFNDVEIRLNDRHRHQLRELVSALGVCGRDVRRMHRCFRRIDVDASGYISTLEFLMSLDVERTDFTNRVFALFDNDGSGKLDFYEFFAACHMFASLSWAALCKCTFRLVDVDGSEVLDVAELGRLVQWVWGAELPDKVEAILRALDADGSRSVSLSEYTERNRAFPILLGPAFQFQLNMRRKVMGAAYWARREKNSVHAADNRHDVLSVVHSMHQEFSQRKWAATTVAAAAAAQHDPAPPDEADADGAASPVEPPQRSRKSRGSFDSPRTTRRSRRSRDSPPAAARRPSSATGRPSSATGARTPEKDERRPSREEEADEERQHRKEVKAEAKEARHEARRHSMTEKSEAKPHHEPRRRSSTTDRSETKPHPEPHRKSRPSKIFVTFEARLASSRKLLQQLSARQVFTKRVICAKAHKTRPKSAANARIGAAA